MRFYFAALSLVFIGLAGAFMLFAEDYQKDRFKGLFTFASPARQCFNYRVSDFKDPSTAYLIESTKFEKTVTIRIRAKNSYGAYGDEYAYCPLNEGKFDESNIIMLNVFQSTVERNGYSCSRPEFFEHFSDINSENGLRGFELTCNSGGQKYRIIMSEDEQVVQQLK